MDHAGLAEQAFSSGRSCRVRSGAVRGIGLRLPLTNKSNKMETRTFLVMFTAWYSTEVKTAYVETDKKANVTNFINELGYQAVEILGWSLVEE